MNLEEETLLDQFRATPMQGAIRVTNIWVVQWLPPEDRETGAELADWANKRRKGWAALYRCHSKHEVMDAISNAASHARNTDFSPVLHIEAHGDKDGIYGPDENGKKRAIPWEELTDPLQNLNEATDCNLLVIMATCIGNAGVQLFTRGPRAPAISLIGPTDNILPMHLLKATKELYWTIESGNAHLDEIVSRMSSESGVVPFVDHRFTEICYNALVSKLIKSARPEEKQKRRAFALEQLMKRGALLEQAENVLRECPEVASGVAESQQMWDQMFCIDVCSENRKRFGLDMAEIYHAAEVLESNRSKSDGA